MEENRNSFKERLLEKLNIEAKKYNASVVQGKTSGMFNLRFKSADDRERYTDGVHKSLSEEKELTAQRIQNGNSSVPISIFTSTNPSQKGSLRVVYKYDIKTRQGLAFEHILTYAINGKITDKLKKRMDIEKHSSLECVQQELNKPIWKSQMDRAFEAVNVLEDYFGGKIVKAEVVGGSGVKADLKLVVPNNKVVGISLKYSIKRDNNFVFNKDLGLGTESKSLITNPRNESWWISARKEIFDKLQKQGYIDKSEIYNPNESDYHPPAWLKIAKESPFGSPMRKMYDETVRDTFSTIRKVLKSSLENMSIEELAALVNETHFGVSVPSNDIPLFKLSSNKKETKLEPIEVCKPCLEKLKQSQDSFITSEGAKINITIPGMPQATIQSVKFRSSLVGAKKGNLKIKTR